MTFKNYRDYSTYYGDFIRLEEVELQEFVEEINWRQDEISIFGKRHLVPRLHAWYGDEKAQYSYSGIKLPRNPWTKKLELLKSLVEEKSGLSFNGALLNLYKDGSSSNGWHSDDERELVSPIHVASLSFGAEREFQIRQKGQSRIGSKVLLEDGSLFIMRAPFQEIFQHQIAKSKKIKEARLNITFRLVRVDS